MSLTRADGKRQMSVAVNLARWQRPDSSGKPQHHPIDDGAVVPAYCGSTAGPVPSGPVTSAAMLKKRSVPLISSSLSTCG
ncbi:hypothetical protein GCM10010353_25910 [Streptomyces chryseus]|uniref:Transposase n=1 Tax=Streptomyces chryseus TaxID=68186 RepID=A0ABQ3DP37_9ACTN|nr:hypothetical protein GCM10010353_25910 [Streptomyces chryseus]GHB05877.1 hypothetical protein GCM10010346_31320 [Streptomyces chryseus]